MMHSDPRRSLFNSTIGVDDAMRTPGIGRTVFAQSQMGSWLIQLNGKTPSAPAEVPRAQVKGGVAEDA
jgi:hypothetical protein